MSKPTPSALSQRLSEALQAHTGLPLYQQLQRALRDAIVGRGFAAAHALPSERRLAADLGISRITVRKAIDGLAADGLLVSRQGSGTFVNVRQDKNFAKLTSFSEDMRSRGATPRSEWLRRSAGQVSPEEALKLALSPGTTVFRFDRLRFADDAPMALEHATVPASALGSIDVVDESLYDALASAGHRPVRALQRLRALVLDATQASLLQAQPGDAGLLVERLGYLADGRAVELSRSYFRGDTYDFIAELAAT